MKKFVFVAVALAGLVGSGFIIQQRLLIGKQSDGSYLVSTAQTLTPVGKVTTFDYQRPKDMAISPDGNVIAVLAHRRLIVLDRSGKLLSEIGLTATPLGVVWHTDGNRLFASSSAGKLTVANWDGEKLSKKDEWVIDGAAEGDPKPKGDPQLTGLAISPFGKRLYVAMSVRNAVAVVDAETGKVTGVIPTGVAPYHIALSGDGLKLAVSNRGGRRIAPPSGQLDPNSGQPFQGTGTASALTAGTAVQIDPVTDAAWGGTISLIDTAELTAREVSVGRQPSGLRFSDDGKMLFVAESDSDSVSFVDVGQGKVAGNISIRPKDDPEFGQIPTDLVQRGNRLFVTCGGINAVAVVDISKTPRVEGYVPTGWYPIAIEAEGDQLFVASSKGIGSRPSNKTTSYGVHDNVGMFQAIGANDIKDLRGLTRKVALNNLWGEQPAARARRQPLPLPQRLGEPSTFKHVVYIIKENLTYDSTFGDMKEGNGDPSLCTFGEEVTPNHHALAREFVLLDNFYTSGTNSADGHQWTSSGIANGYIEQNYAANQRSYPYDGGDPLAYSPEGFLWTAARKAGRSVRVFGEFVNKPKVLNPATGRAPTWTEAWNDYKSGANKMIIEAHTDNAALQPLLSPKYIGFPSIISDQYRADVFLGELDEWVRKAEMPNLVMMLLPNNHTVGTSAGFPTPRATVADNDLALGRIVEAISKSPFWKETLILVVEDDSQLGTDHVDGHRSVAFCISPYTRRGAVVSDFYNHTSFLRTIGLVLGIPPMNRFDRVGAPLAACFTPSMDAKPFTALKNNIPLDQMNPNPKALSGLQRELAIECTNLDWSDVDRAHAKTVAMAAWYSVKPNVPFPEHFYRPPMDQDDEDE